MEVEYRIPTKVCIKRCSTLHQFIYLNDGMAKVVVHAAISSMMGFLYVDALCRDKIADNGAAACTLFWHCCWLWDLDTVDGSLKAVVAWGREVEDNGPALNFASGWGWAAPWGTFVGGCITPVGVVGATASPYHRPSHPGQWIQLQMHSLLVSSASSSVSSGHWN